MFAIITRPITSLGNTLIKACETLEDFIGLIHTEVKNLDQEQQIRMDKIVAERLALKAEREKASKPPRVTTKKTKRKTKKS